MRSIGLIGCGNMGEAIVSGLLKAKWVSPKDIIISTKTRERSNKIQHDYGVEIASSNREVAQKASILILAIKPILYREVLGEILPYLDKTKIVVSITPSFSLKALRQMSGGAPVVRAMPNTPAKIGWGMTGLAFEKDTPQEIRQELIALFSCLGQVLEVPEDMMKVVGSLSGSAPAFIELFMKAMVDAGVSYGMSMEDARTLVTQTFLGTAKLAQENQKPFESMMNDVCSKGGSTIRGVTSLKENGFEAIVQQAVAKTTERFIEMNHESDDPRSK